MLSSSWCGSKSPVLTPPDAAAPVLGDKPYDTDSFRAFLQYKKIHAVIPSSACRKRPYPLDQEAYRRRNVIERMFCRLKDWRRIATVPYVGSGLNEQEVRAFNT
jgi:transposase